MKYDIFISYRRKGGAERAELLKAIFTKHGYDETRIFMDTHSLRGGDFRVRLADAIENSNNIVVLITKGCFDEIKENDFWLFEIAKAIELKKNVIPVFFDGITSIEGEGLPQTLKELPSQNAIGYSHEYADAFYSKLLSFLKTESTIDQKYDCKSRVKTFIEKNKKKCLTLGTLLILCLVLFIFVINKLNQPITNEYGLKEQESIDIQDYDFSSDNKINTIISSEDDRGFNNSEDEKNFMDEYSKLKHLYLNEKKDLSITERVLGNKTNADNDTIVLSSGLSIDLGLSVEWASCNVGATLPEEPGGYYAWGEINEKDEYNKETYKYTYKEYGYIKTKKIASNISGTRYDVAKSIMGDDFRIPTKQEMKELILNCTWDYYYYKGQSGFIVKGTNGNTIFIPAVGHKENMSNGHVSYYWTSNVDEYGTPYCLHISAYSIQTDVDLINHVSVENGLPVRAVRSKQGY